MATRSHGHARPPAFLCRVLGAWGADVLGWGQRPQPRAVMPARTRCPSSLRDSRDGVATRIGVAGRPPRVGVHLSYPEGEHSPWEGVISAVIRCTGPRPAASAAPLWGALDNVAYVTGPQLMRGSTIVRHLSGEKSGRPGAYPRLPSGFRGDGARVACDRQGAATRAQAPRRGTSDDGGRGLALLSISAGPVFGRGRWRRPPGRRVAHRGRDAAARRSVRRGGVVDGGRQLDCLCCTQCNRDSPGLLVATESQTCGLGGVSPRLRPLPGRSAAPIAYKGHYLLCRR